MKIFRIRWRFLKRIIKILVFLYLIKLFLGWLFKKEEPSLKYDYLKRTYFIKLSSFSNHISNLELDQLERIEKNERVPFQIKSVSLKYSKILVENWASLIESAVSLGANAIEIEIPWNAHEPVQKQYEFSKGTSDLETFIKLVNNYKLFLLVRIDPYLPCSSYDLGGLPSWLLGELDLESREGKYGDSAGGLLNLNDFKFRDAFQSYLEKLLPILSKNQLIKNGPIIGILIKYIDFEPDVSNPYDLSSFYDSNYVDYMSNILQFYGIYEIVLKSKNSCDKSKTSLHQSSYCDPHLNTYLPIEDRKALVITTTTPLAKVNSYNRYHCVENNLRKYWKIDDPDSPKSLNQEDAQIKEKFEIRSSILNYKSNLVELLKVDKSFNIQNFYCEMNFGFSAGSHHDKQTKSILSFSTSYIDSFYDCLLDETGELNKKYKITHKLLRSKGDYRLNSSVLKQEDIKAPSVISHIKVDKLSTYIERNRIIALNITHVLPFNKILENLHYPIHATSDRNDLFMEFVNIKYKVFSSNYGFILYRNDISLKAGSIISINTNYVKDYAVILCDSNRHLLTVDHLKRDSNNKIKIKLEFDCNSIDVLVENAGRLSDLTNPRTFSNQRKGILKPDAITYQRSSSARAEIMENGWKINFFDFLPKFFNRFTFNSEWLSREELNIKTMQGPFMAYTFFNANKSNVTSKGIYICIKNWNRGIALINGFNLGRYRSVGPVLSYFIPESLLNDGKNELIIFELHNVSDLTFYISKSHVIV